MVIYVCENCVDGIFTGVYDAWASRLGHANVALRVEGPANLELFAEYRNVRTDGEKARKVADTIRRKMGTRSYEMIYCAALANALEKADCIYRVLAVGLSRHTDSRTARHLLEKLQDKNASRVFELSRRVYNEAHRYEGFVRFREVEKGVLFSEIEAENQVLPLLGGYFSDRFPNENFLIYDHHSGECLVHAARRQWFIWRGAWKELPRQYKESSVTAAGSPGEKRWKETLSEEEVQLLWRGFCGSISICERENPRLQMQFWPLRFRKWMTEGSGQQ